MTIYGGIEAGGTKWVCGVGDGDGALLASRTIPTTTPAETIATAVEFFAQHERPEAVGIGCFGPVDVRPSSPTFGYITTTPKAAWRQTDILTPLRRALEVPLRLDTDVNAAALGEWSWGHGRGLDVVSYVTVGTGIGGGAVVHGRALHGLLHPELGHVRIPHDRDRDPFAGACPYHGDCFEGLASGRALELRWGRPAEELDREEVWQLEADYLALGLINVIHALAPQRLIIGGGVMRRPDLLGNVRARVRALLGGYLETAALTDADALDGYIVSPCLGDRAGVVGAIELARSAIEPSDGVAARPPRSGPSAHSVVRPSALG